MTTQIIDGNLVITLPMQKEIKPSASGKTLIVATTSGNKETEAEVDGKKVFIGVNAWIKP